MVCNSRRKGKNAELACAKILNELLPHAQCRRSQQFKGDKTAADLTCDGLPGVMFEVKRRQSMNIHKVMAESLAHCTEAMLPVILHRKDNEEWLLTIRLEDLPKALEKFSEGNTKGISKDVEPGPD